MVSSHPECGICGQRFRTVDERDEHEASHPSCRICQVVLHDINAIDDHEASEHFKCHYCERFFDSHSNLVNHFKTHAAKDIPCPRCPRAFISHSALVLHFERNTCPGDMSMDWVDRTARECAEFLGNHVMLSPRGSGFPYKCPTCGCGAKYMSALLQHVESEACAEDIRDGPLTDFIRQCEDGSPHSRGRFPPVVGSYPPGPAVSHFFETEPFSGYSQPMNFFVMGHAGVSVSIHHWT
ncbi:hypothetical protein B0T11DRAFT_287088 [Plectosphaerella cucumerina]|uniref:C2H2-type domain-containing protein n=1 Tax=Plectosphaerella cucumerina TaxID=40658 RepID=A0A8K0WZM5_9PEZI|nr:hypothetical protein B0T11DRAFT_287088 [Plectosphaerella cucumerina]